MNRIYIPTNSADDWRKYLAEQGKQWRQGYSARELAKCWERANGFPEEIRSLFSGSEEHVLNKLELLLAIPQYQVDLPGKGRPSQSDLFVLARAKDGQMVTMIVEGKVGEPFGDTLETWLKGASKSKKERLAFLCEVLGLQTTPPLNIRYQLLYRTASAIIEAGRFNAKYAIMMVHSFSPKHQWFSDYQDFLGLFGMTGRVNELVELPNPHGMHVYAGWVVGQKK
jgi:hypothetical protein